MELKRPELNRHWEIEPAGLRTVRRGLSATQSKMARHSGKKKNSLERNEFLLSGKRFRVSVPEDLHVLEDHDNQRLVKAQACWGSFGGFIPYNAIVDPGIDCLEANCFQSLQVSSGRYYPFASMEERSNGNASTQRLMAKNGRTFQCWLLISEPNAT